MKNYIDLLTVLSLIANFIAILGIILNLKHLKILGVLCSFLLTFILFIVITLWNNDSLGYMWLLPMVLWGYNTLLLKEQY